MNNWRGDGPPPVETTCMISVMHCAQDYRATIKYISNSLVVFSWVDNNDVELCVGTRDCTFEYIETKEELPSKEILEAIQYWGGDIDEDDCEDLAEYLHDMGCRMEDDE